MESIVKPIIWSKRAKKDLEKILFFNATLLGEDKAKKIVFKIFQRTLILENRMVDFKKIGIIDEDFLHLKNEYRKLTEKNYRITYREGKTKIFIVRVFDMRQNPKKNL